MRQHNCAIAVYRGWQDSPLDGNRWPASIRVVIDRHGDQTVLQRTVVDWKRIDAFDTATREMLQLLKTVPFFKK